MIDGQPVGVHKATGIERSNTEHASRSEDGGSNSTPEGISAGSPQLDAFATPLAVRDPQGSEAGTDAKPIRDLEHTACNAGSVSDAVSSLGSVRRNYIYD